MDGLIGGIRIHADGRIEAGFLPTWSAPPGRPEVACPEGSPGIATYIDVILPPSRAARLELAPQRAWYVRDPTGVAQASFGDTARYS